MVGGYLISRNGEAIDLNPWLADTISDRRYPFEDVIASVAGAC